MKVKINEDGSFTFSDASGVRVVYADAEMLAASHGLLMQDHDALRERVKHYQAGDRTILSLESELAEARQERAKVEAMLAIAESGELKEIVANAVSNSQ